MAHGNDYASYADLLLREAIWKAAFRITHKTSKLLYFSELRINHVSLVYIRSHSLVFIAIRCSYFWPDIGQLGKSGLKELCLGVVGAVRFIGGAEGDRTPDLRIAN